MAFELNFAEEFFFAPGEPLDAPLAVNSEGEPTSLYSAISALIDELSAEDVAELASSVDSSPGAEDFAYRLVERARRTNTCSDLESPVEVWIDSEGDFRVLVHGE